MNINSAPASDWKVIYKLGRENTKTCILQSPKNVSFGVFRGILIYTDFTEDPATDVYLEVTRSQTCLTRILYRFL